jgi:PadR family transcriptional regulator, regulatory protein PadR
MKWPFRVTDPLLDVVEVLLDAGDDLHGWAIMKRTRRTGPTVYQVLERLRKARWVECWWEDRQDPAEAPAQVGHDHRGISRSESLPRRRYYRLSGEGAAKAPVLLAERGRRPSGLPVRGAAPGLAFFGRRLRIATGSAGR